MKSLVKKKNSNKIAGQIRRFLNNEKVHKTFDVVTRAHIALTPFIEKPSMWTACKSFFSLVVEMTRAFELYGDEFFEHDPDWEHIFNRDFTQIILESIKNYDVDSIPLSENSRVIKVVSLSPTTKIGWIEGKSGSAVYTIWCNGDRQEAFSIINQLLWEKFEGKPVVMTNNRYINNNEDRVVFKLDESFYPLPSTIADNLSSHISKCIKAGVFRSIMLYGPPGTGKSTIARKICENLNLMSLRIKVEDVGNLDSETLFSSIDLFKPDVVIFDDYDRASNSAMLDILEYLQKKVKLVIATANNIRNVDQAILRPGRFDELHKICKLDENVIKNVLGDYVENYDLVKDWPIAFVQEFVKRLMFMSPEDAKNSMIELTQRVADIDSHENFVDDTWASLKQVSSSSQHVKPIKIKSRN